MPWGRKNTKTRQVTIEAEGDKSLDGMTQKRK